MDIKEKKLTLPLIYSLDKVSKSDRRWMIDVVKNKNEDDRSVKRLVEMVSEAGGIAHAHARMLEYRDKAIGTLHTFPKNEYRDALEGLVQLTVERTK